MNAAKFVSAAVVLFVWGFLYERFIAPMISASAMASIPGLVATPSTLWVIVGSITGIVVTLWFYERVRATFGGGIAGGAKFGLYTGVLMNFPMWLYFSLYTGWPYASMWHFTLVGIVMSVINGAIIGLVYEKVGSAKAV